LKIYKLNIQICPPFHPHTKGGFVSDLTGFIVARVNRTSVPGLYFCGYYLSPTGMLREIAMEAKQISAAIAR